MTTARLRGSFNRRRSSAPGAEFCRAIGRITALVCVAASSTAYAQPAQPTPADVATARELATEGIILADAGDCKGAIEKLDRAAKLYYAPTIFARLGECQILMGKLVLGTENLRRVVREDLPAKAPPAFVEAKARAQKTLDAAEPRIARLRIDVKAPPGVELLVTVDAQPITAASLDVARPADPGIHEVKASAPGYRVAVANVTLRDGDSQSIALSLEPETMPAATKAPPEIAPIATSVPISAPKPAAPRTPAKGPIPVLPWIATGALTAGAIVTGVLALSASSDLDTKLNTFGVTPAELGNAGSKASRLALATDVLGGAAIVMGGISIYLTVNRGPRAEQTRNAATLEVRAGPGSLSASGRF